MLTWPQNAGGYLISEELNFKMFLRHIFLAAFIIFSSIPALRSRVTH